MKQNLHTVFVVNLVGREGSSNMREMSKSSDIHLDKATATGGFVSGEMGSVHTSAGKGGTKNCFRGEELLLRKRQGLRSEFVAERKCGFAKTGFFLAAHVTELGYVSAAHARALERHGAACVHVTGRSKKGNLRQCFTGGAAVLHHHVSVLHGLPCCVIITHSFYIGYGVK